MTPSSLAISAHDHPCARAERTCARSSWSTSFRRAAISPGAVAVLNAAQRQRAARGDRRTTARHLLLGMLAQPGLIADALAARGITLASVLQAMDASGPQEAGR